MEGTQTLIIPATRKGAPLESATTRRGRRGLGPPTRQLLPHLLRPHHASYSSPLGPTLSLGGPLRRAVAWPRATPTKITSHT
jgi:hypothetical protein